MISILNVEGDLIELRVDGRVVAEDYARVIPEFERVIAQHGSVRCLLDLTGMGSITPGALAADLKFDVTHAREIGRCAVVTDHAWHAWMTRAWGVLMPKAEVRCFGPDERAEAGAWVRAS